MKKNSGLSFAMVLSVFCLTAAFPAWAAASTVSRREAHERYLEHQSNGVQAKQFNDWDLAVQEFTEALSWEPNNIIAQKNLVLIKKMRQNHRVRAAVQDGLIDYRRGRFVDALFAFREVLSLDPLNGPVQNIIAQVQHEADNAARKTEANEVDQLVALGMDAYVEGDNAEAIRQWQAALEQDPTQTRARNYLRKAQTQALEKARQQKLQTLTTPQRAADAAAQKGFLYYMLGETQKAVSSWKKALALDPQNEDAGRALEIIGNNQGRPGNALFLRWNGSVEQLSAEALRQYSDGHLQNALNIWKKALTIDPYNMAIKNNIARVEAEMSIKARQNANENDRRP